MDRQLLGLLLGNEGRIAEFHQRMLQPGARFLQLGQADGLAVCFAAPGEDGLSRGNLGSVG